MKVKGIKGMLKRPKAIAKAITKVPFQVPTLINYKS